MWGFSLNIRVSSVAPRRISHPNLDTLSFIEGRNRRFLRGCSRWSILSFFRDDCSRLRIFSRLIEGELEKMRSTEDGLVLKSPSAQRRISSSLLSSHCNCLGKMTDSPPLRTSCSVSNQTLVF